MGESIKPVSMRKENQMKHEIRSRWTGSVTFTAEIEAEEHTPKSIKDGLAVKWALKSDANLRFANLRDADLRYADLSDANLRGADLRYADLRDANLRDADLRDANLRDANLRYADLLCFGNMQEIRTMQIDRWGIGYTADTLQIGCQSHAIEKWKRWNTEAGRKWISQMDEYALDWADRNLNLVLQIIDANPANPTGHEENKDG